MSDFHRINSHRPGKIIDMIEMINASARSQKATPQEVADLMAPVMMPLGATPPASALQPPAQGAAAPPIITHDGVLVGTLRHALERSTEAEITAALAWVVAHRKLTTGA
jgi:hypothetical protein